MLRSEVDDELEVSQFHTVGSLTEVRLDWEGMKSPASGTSAEHSNQGRF
jgi:hypothetical protein